MNERFPSSGPMFLTAALLALAGAGCGPARPTMPQMHPVQGKVYYQGGQPVADGLIEFRSKSDPAQTVNGPIDQDGRFTLGTIVGNERLPGAPEGEYEATVIPPMGGDQRSESIRVRGLFKVGPGENEFRIVLDVPPRR